MTKTVNINVFDPQSIDKAIQAIERLQSKLAKLDDFNKRLSDIGVTVAREAFDSVAMFDSRYGGVEVTVEYKENGFTIKANGENVAYAEFGAGVYYNGAEPYQGERPSGIDRIGQHDTINGSNKSKGTRQLWAYYTDNEAKTGLQKTRGIPASQGMYLARKYMAEETVNIFKEIFDD